MFKVFINNGMDKPPSDDIFYIIGKKGIFLKKKVGIMESIAPVKNISVLEDVETSAHLHIPKIPGKLFAKVYKFTKEVYKLYSSESVTLLYYNEHDKSFKILIPDQEVSGSSVDYKEIESIDNHNLIGTIHSHAGFSAFHSPTDDKDEKHFDGIHITIGDLKSDTFELSCSIVSNGSRFMNIPEEYIEGIKLVGSDNPKIISKDYILNNSIKYISFDRTWLNKVKRKVYTPSKVYGYLNSYYNLYDDNLNLFNNFSFKDRDKNKVKTVDNVFDFDDLDDFNPCEDCPFKNFKMEMVLEELIEDEEEDLDELTSEYYGL